MDTHDKPGRYMGIDDIKLLAKDFSVNNLFKQQGYRCKPLGFDQAYMLGVFALVPYVPELEGIFELPENMVLLHSVAALTKFHGMEFYKDPASAGQIAGICAAIFDYDIGTSSNGYLFPEVDEVIDNCGMGGDLHRTPNLSTISALIASAGGIKMLKHGSPGNTDSVGSSDFLASCGVNLFNKKENVEEAVRRFGFGYTDALDTSYKRIHLQTHNAAKLAHMNDIIGPVTNPVHPRYMKRRIIGINHLMPPERIAEAYKILNEKGLTYVEHGLFIRGFADKARNGGIDEVSIMEGGTVVAELKDGQISRYDLFAKDFGLEEINVASLDPGADKAGTSRKILNGKICDERRDAALANAAVLFYLAEGIDVKEGTIKARTLLQSGKPYEILMDYARFSQGGE